jgi:hypothetical protein
MKSTNLAFLQAHKEDQVTHSLIGYLHEREAELKNELVTTDISSFTELQGRVKEIQHIIFDITKKLVENEFKSGAYNP